MYCEDRSGRTSISLFIYLGQLASHTTTMRGKNLALEGDVQSWLWKNCGQLPPKRVTEERCYSPQGRHRTVSILWPYGQYFTMAPACAQTHTSQGVYFLNVSWELLYKGLVPPAIVTKSSWSSTHSGTEVQANVIQYTMIRCRKNGEVSLTV